MISQLSVLNTKNMLQKKKGRCFLSVEDPSTIDKNWKKVEFYGSSVFQFYVSGGNNI